MLCTAILGCCAQAWMRHVPGAMGDVHDPWLPETTLSVHVQSMTSTTPLGKEQGQGQGPTLV